jgi:hypothetical protein
MNNSLSDLSHNLSDLFQPKPNFLQPDGVKKKTNNLQRVAVLPSMLDADESE